MSRTGHTGGDAIAGPMMARTGHPRRSATVWISVAFLVLMALIGGFVVFVGTVHRDVSPAATSADGIVVLTGGRSRLEAAVQLLIDGRGDRLLISGVNSDVSSETLRKTLGLDEGQFACCVDLDHAALDTIGNAQGSAVWVKANGFDSLIVVTNDYHMPRALLEFRRAMPEVDFIAWPVANGISDAGDPVKQLDRYRVLLSEYVKFLVASARGVVLPGDGFVSRAGLAAGW